MPTTWPIAEYMNAAAIECSIPQPVAWVTGVDMNVKVMRQFLNDTVRELARRHDWQQMTSSQVITGTGVESYALASDFMRLARGDNAVYENQPNRRPCVSVERDGDWTELKQTGFTGVQRYYRFESGSIEFFRALPSGGTVTVAYVSGNWKRDSLGATPGDTWVNDTDTSILPGHLLQLGVVWRFRRHKGLQYADRKAEFEVELARAITDDRPTGRVAFDGYRNLPRTPFAIPVPDYIPPGP